MMPTCAFPRLAAAALLMAGGCAIMDPDLLDRDATEDVVDAAAAVDAELPAVDAAAAVDAEVPAVDAAVDGSPVVNLIVNGDFEMNTNGWQNNGGGQLSRSTARAHTGNASLLTQQRTEPWMGPTTPLTGLVLRGRRYTATAHVLLAAPGTALTRLTVRHTCAGSAPAFNADAVVDMATANPTNWVQPSLTFRVNDAPTCTLVEIVLYAEMETSTASFYLDDVVLREVP